MYRILFCVLEQDTQWFHDMYDHHKDFLDMFSRGGKAGSYFIKEIPDSVLPVVGISKISFNSYLFINPISRWIPDASYCRMMICNVVFLWSHAKVSIKVPRRSFSLLYIPNFSSQNFSDWFSIWKEFALSPRQNMQVKLFNFFFLFPENKKTQDRRKVKWECGWREWRLVDRNKKWKCKFFRKFSLCVYVCVCLLQVGRSLLSFLRDNRKKWVKNRGRKIMELEVKFNWLDL